MSYWAETIPGKSHERPLHSPKSQCGALLPQLQLLVSDSLRKMKSLSLHINILQELFPTARWVEPRGQKQDGAMTHTARAWWLWWNTSQNAKGRICRGQSDLSSWDFFPEFFFKSCVYVNRPRTLKDFKANIQADIANITPAMVKRAMTKARNRCTQFENEGHHLHTWLTLQNFRDAPTLKKPNENFLI